MSTATAARRNPPNWPELENAQLLLVARSLKWRQRDVENAQVLFLARTMERRNT